MSLVYYYREPGDDSIPDPIALDDDRVRLYTFDASMNAEEGSIGISTFTVDDIFGDFDIAGHRIFAAEETEVTGSDTFVYVGYTAERRYSRMESDRVGASRKIEVTTVDINTVLERRVMTGSDANRPAETDVQRVQWLVATNEGHLVNTSRYLSTSNPVNMDKVDYRGQMFKSVLDDCAQSSGKDYWLTYHGDNATAKYPWGTFELFYDFRSSSVYPSTIALSNVLTDIDNTTTFAISAENTSLRRDPSRVYSGVYMNYDGGAVYEQDNSTALAFARRDAISDAANVKTNARANARAQRYLNDISTEEDVITTSFQVPAAYVNHLREGMRVQIRATHLPGYETAQWMRVLNRNVKQVSEALDATYLITAELGTSGESSGRPSIMYVLARITQADELAVVEASDDGVSWTTIIPDMQSGAIAGTNGDLWAVPGGEEDHRYWSVKVTKAHGGGFFAGYVQVALRLLDADGVDALGTAGHTEVTGPPIPWAIDTPVTLSGPSVPYTATSNGDKAQMHGVYHNACFANQYPGPVTGDFTIGSCSSDTRFGLNSGVFGAGTITARWVWDLGE